MFAREMYAMGRYGIPCAFVFIWSTGFIVARAAAPHADVQLFLLVRFLATTALMATSALATRCDWPPPRQALLNLLTGGVMLGIYLTSSYWAIAQGMPAGIMALLGALQPLFTALWLAARARRLPRTRTGLGLLIGFTGVVAVLLPKLAVGAAHAVTGPSLGAALVSILAVTAGTLYQQRLPPTDLAAASAWQNLGAALVALLAFSLVGETRWEGTAHLWGALSWSVLVTSGVGSTLLMWMMRHGEATKVTSLFLLVPPLAAAQAYLLFGERLSAPQLLGFMLALGGVLLVRTERRR